MRRNTEKIKLFDIFYIHPADCFPRQSKTQDTTDV
jgi:hypothetical protein